MLYVDHFIEYTDRRKELLYIVDHFRHCGQKEKEGFLYM